MWAGEVSNLDGGGLHTMQNNVFVTDVKLMMDLFYSSFPLKNKDFLGLVYET